MTADPVRTALQDCVDTMRAVTGHIALPPVRDRVRAVVERAQRELAEETVAGRMD